MATSVLIICTLLLPFIIYLIYLMIIFYQWFVKFP